MEARWRNYSLTPRKGLFEAIADLSTVGTTKQTEIEVVRRIPRRTDGSVAG